MTLVAESETLFLDLVTHHPKRYWLVAGGSVDSLRPQNLIEPLKNGITEDPEG